MLGFEKHFRLNLGFLLLLLLLSIFVNYFFFHRASLGADPECTTAERSEPKFTHLKFVEKIDIIEILQFIEDRLPPLM